ncbi:MAG: DUF3570 domain-containing protein [Bacteroidota bacterium]|nr:DUF3570 domain-containing protein [Bacteroidota bacterium]
MKKICLTVAGFYFMILSAFSQRYDIDTTSYKSHKLKLDEMNLVSGYYTQNGDHSAVTGGIGTQKLNDVSNVIDLQFVKWNEKNNKYSLGFELGVDHHTAASQSFVSQTGASKLGGTRIYPSVNWQVEKSNGLSLGAGASFSTEYNYHSNALNFSIGKTSKNKNTEINFKGQAFFDKVTLIEPSELIPKVVQSSPSTYTTASGNVVSVGGSGSGKKNIPKSPRNTYAGSLTISQVVNKNFQVALITDIVAQKGFLSLPFHRVYFNDGTEKIENLPDTRVKLPLGVRLNYFLGDKIILRSYYRYYTDNWGIKSQTASLEIPYKISPFVSVSPFYRYYVQTAADYFAPYGTHATTDQYYSSNYDLSAFNSQFFGVNLKITPKNGVFNVPFFNTLELRYGHYTQTTGLQADNIGINLKFK